MSLKGGKKLPIIVPKNVLRTKQLTLHTLFSVDLIKALEDRNYFLHFKVQEIKV